MSLRDLDSFLTANHEDMAAEQATFDRIGAIVEERKAELRELISEDTGATPQANARVREAIAQRLDDYSDDRQLIVGSIVAGSQRHHVGRRTVLDHDQEPVVLNWRDPAAAPFLHAKRGNAHGIVNRRRYRLDGWRVDRIFDEFFDDRPRPSIRVEDVLLRDLKQYRPGELCDILETIEAEQAALLEEPLDGVMVIDGGPGTGKTIVALMRLALHVGRVPATHDELGLLVVGPTRTYVEYVHRVLPGLGEDDVLHQSVDDVAATKVKVSGRDPRAVERLKGDARMADVLERAVREAVRVRDAVVPVLGSGVITVPEEIVATLMRRRASGYRVAREQFRERLSAVIADRVLDRDPRRATEADLAGLIRRSSGFRRACEQLWPTFTAHQLLWELLGSPMKLAEVSAGILTGEEVQLLYRKPADELSKVEWTSADLPLLDEIEHLLERPRVTYRHVLVDEAQDMTPMQMRMIARRCPTRSITLLGDLVQATGPYPHVDWASVTAPLTSADVQIRVARLRYGYRVPREVAGVAKQILRRVDPDIEAPRFVGDGLGEVHQMKSDPDCVVADVVQLVQHILAQSRPVSVGVITPLGAETELRAALVEAGVSAGGADHLSHPVTVLPPYAARGLEFTHLVVVRPGEIVEEDSDGYKRLYVAVTRCCEFLEVVHYGEWEELLRPYTREELYASALSNSERLLWMLNYIDRADRYSVLEMCRRPLPAATVPDAEVALAALVAILETDEPKRSRLIQYVEDRLAYVGETG